MDKGRSVGHFGSKPSRCQPDCFAADGDPRENNLHAADHKHPHTAKLDREAVRASLGRAAASDRPQFAVLAGEPGVRVPAVNELPCVDRPVLQTVAGASTPPSG